METQIEVMRAMHLPAVLKFWRGIEGVGLNESDTIANLDIYLLRNPGLSRVVFAGIGEGGPPEVVGAILCGHDGRRGYLHHLAVASEFRRRGIGRRLVAECLGELGRIGITRCNLFVYASNTAGQEFWLAGGWRVRGELCLMQRQTLPGPGDSTRLEPAC